MKTKLLILLLITTLFACNKDDDNNGESLPAATQVGANTVGCLVNGEVFLPHAEGLSPSVNCFYQFVDGEYFFTMNFADLRGTGFKEFFVQTGRTQLMAGQTYTLNKNYDDDIEYIGGGAGYSTSLTDNYITYTINIGELLITKIDVSNSIVSGTFWFNAINNEGVIVEIREGRFDWNY